MVRLGYIFFILLLISVSGLFSQSNNFLDVILKRNNSCITQCKILRVTDSDIEYKIKSIKHSLIIPRYDVKSIIYQDGTVLSFEVEKKVEKNEVQQIQQQIIVSPQNREEICRNCNGSGYVRATCPNCNGAGNHKCTNCTNGLVLKWVIEYKQRAHFENVTCDVCNGTTIVRCSYCNGTGLMSSVCTACNGSGKVTINR